MWRQFTLCIGWMRECRFFFAHFAALPSVFANHNFTVFSGGMQWPKLESQGGDLGAPMSPGECASIRSPGNCRFLTIRTAYRLIILYCSFCCGDVAKSALLYKTEKCAKSHACHGTLYALLVDDSLGCGAWRYVRRSLTSSHRGVCTFSERS